MKEQIIIEPGKFLSKEAGYLLMGCMGFSESLEGFDYWYNLATRRREANFEDSFLLNEALKYQGMDNRYEAISNYVEKTPEELL